MGMSMVLVAAFTMLQTLIPFLAQAANSTLLHNSTNTGSTYWGGWGIEGGQYGKFTCLTCHSPSTSNIKRVIGSISIPSLPGDGVAIAYNSAVNGSSDLGDDTGGHTSSSKICEVCHSLTRIHRYDTTGQTDLGHYNQTDCTSCHAHRNAFRPVGTSCNQCHGNAPTTGAHAFHVIVVDQGTAEDRSDCAVCHLGAESYTYDPGIDRMGGLNHGNAAGRKVQLTTAIGYIETDQTCTSACHKSSDTDGAWNDTDGLNCDSCHYWSATPTTAENNAYLDATGASASLSCKHNKHFATGLGCVGCHGTQETQGSGLDHNNTKNAATDADKIRYQGYGFLNPTGTAINVDDSAYNSAVNSWVNSAVTTDVGNTCANTLCHNPSKTTYKADWDVDVADCILCHSATNPATGAHAKHLTDRNVVYGGNLSCNTCHVDNGTNTAHRNGTVNYRITVSSICHSCHSRSGGICSGCHFGTLSQIWAKPSFVTGCVNCHSQTPSSYDHTVHISGTSGPVLGTDCGACHEAQANNTSMAGITTHMNMTDTFRNRAEPASPYEVTPTTIGDTANDAVDSCDNCHGGAAAGLIAKDYWKLTTDVTCESCHGNIPANSKADGSGVTAPNKSSYSSKGHGKTGVAKVCTDCHNNAAAHISGSLGDATRLQDLSGINYGSDPNGYCGVCHLKAANVHYANTKTTGGTSFTATACATCHDPHGEVGNTMDAMLLQTIDGKTVTGFADKSLRSSYYITTPNSGANVGKYGICQVCHDPAEVNYFNRTTESNSSHKGSNLCTNCHDHTHTPGFNKN